MTDISPTTFSIPPTLPTLPTFSTCTHCQQVLPVTEFYKNKASRSGLTYRCKDCLNQYRLANREAEAERRRRYQQKNKDRISAKKKEYRIAHREKIRGYDRKYDLSHRAQRAESRRQAYRKNRDTTRLIKTVECLGITCEDFDAVKTCADKTGSTIAQFIRRAVLETALRVLSLENTPGHPVPEESKPRR